MASESKTRLSLRLAGDLPPERDLTRALGVTPDHAHYRVWRAPPGNILPNDVWLVELIGRERWHGPDPVPDALERAQGMLRTMAPGLAAQDRARCRVELSLSAISWDREGMVRLPADL